MERQQAITIEQDFHVEVSAVALQAWECAELHHPCLLQNSLWISSACSSLIKSLQNKLKQIFSVRNEVWAPCFAYGYSIADGAEPESISIQEMNREL